VCYAFSSVELKLIKSEQLKTVSLKTFGQSIEKRWYKMAISSISTNQTNAVPQAQAAQEAAQARANEEAQKMRAQREADAVTISRQAQEAAAQAAAAAKE